MSANDSQGFQSVIQPLFCSPAASLNPLDRGAIHMHCKCLDEQCLALQPGSIYVRYASEKRSGSLFRER
jgi:hypothetical protein